MLKWCALHVQTRHKDLKVAKAPSHTNFQSGRDGEIDASSPQSWLTGAHLISLAYLRAFFCHTAWWQLLFAKDATRMYFYFFLFSFLFFLPLKSFLFKCNISLAYFERCSFKVRVEKKKTESKARGIKMWAQQLCEEWKIKVSGRQMSRKVAKEVQWWAGALIAKDNGQYEQRDAGSSPSIILSLSSDPVGTPRTW